MVIHVFNGCEMHCKSYFRATSRDLLDKRASGFGDESNIKSRLIAFLIQSLVGFVQDSFKSCEEI